MSPGEALFVGGIVLFIALLVGLGALAIYGLRTGVAPSPPSQPAQQVHPAPESTPTSRSTSAPRVRRRASRPGATLVEPNRNPLWVLRGWRRRGNELIGAYRTARGSVSGIVQLDGQQRALSYVILNPPEALLTGPHGACFRRRGEGRYWVHFSQSHLDVDAGIVAVERLLTLALA